MYFVYGILVHNVCEWSNCGYYSTRENSGLRIGFARKFPVLDWTRSPHLYSLLTLAYINNRMPKVSKGTEWHYLYAKPAKPSILDQWSTKYLCGPKQLIETRRKITTFQNENNINNTINYFHNRIYLRNILFVDKICKECV